MFSLLLAIISSACVSLFMRFSEKYLSNKMMMFVANYALCILFSYIYMEDGLMISYSQDYIVMLILGLISGVLYLASFVFLKSNMKYNGVVLSSTFMKLGVLIPTIMAIVVFKEVPRITQIIGIILAIIAIILINFDKSGVKEGNKKLWLIALLFMSGFTDSMANIFDKLCNIVYQDMYLLVTFFVACVISLVLVFNEKKKSSIKDLLFGVLIGIPNYYSSRFLLAALNKVSAVIVYPVYSIATIITISLIGVLFFKESINSRKLCALAIIVVALALLNI